MQWVYGNSWLAVLKRVGILQVPVRIADHHIAKEKVWEERGLTSDVIAACGSQDLRSESRYRDCSAEGQKALHHTFHVTVSLRR
jgi:hypothetical protein